MTPTPEQIRSWDRILRSGDLLTALIGKDVDELELPVQLALVRRLNALGPDESDVEHGAEAWELVRQALMR